MKFPFSSRQVLRPSRISEELLDYIDQLRAELHESGDGDTWREACGRCEVAIERLRAECSQLRDDAERWRTVLARVRIKLLPPFWKVDLPLPSNYETVEEAFTVAIDAMRKETDENDK